MLSPINHETRIVYLGTLVGLTLIISSLQFITITISAVAPGIVRSASEVSVLRSPVSGKIVQSNAVDNAHVAHGSLLFTIDSDALREQMTTIQSKLDRDRIVMSDLRTALSASQMHRPERSPLFQTSVVNQYYRAFYEALGETNTILHKAQTEYIRQKKLFDARVIAAKEYEGYQYEWQKAQNNKRQVIETHRNRWETELREIAERIHDGESRLISLELEQSSYQIIAPISGTLQQAAVLFPGTFVVANQELVQISPDTSVVVVTYVDPDDIADLKPGMPVRLQVEAYNHHQWGLAQGHVVDVATDSELINNAWVYKVRCSLDRDYVKNPSGKIGAIKRGMTLRAYFPKYDQSVWQLIYQKADEQLNPYAYKR